MGASLSLSPEVSEHLPGFAQENPTCSSQDFELLEASYQHLSTGYDDFIDSEEPSNAPFGLLFDEFYQRLSSRRRLVSGGRNMTVVELFDYDRTRQGRFLGELLDLIVSLVSVAVQAFDHNRESLAALSRHVKTIEESVKRQSFVIGHYNDIGEALLGAIVSADSLVTTEVRNVWLQAYSGYLLIAISAILNSKPSGVPSSTASEFSGRNMDTASVHSQTAGGGGGGSDYGGGDGSSASRHRRKHSGYARSQESDQDWSQDGHRRQARGSPFVARPGGVRRRASPHAPDDDGGHYESKASSTYQGAYEAGAFGSGSPRSGSPTDLHHGGGRGGGDSASARDSGSESAGKHSAHADSAHSMAARANMRRTFGNPSVPAGRGGTGPYASHAGQGAQPPSRAAQQVHQADRMHASSPAFHSTGLGSRGRYSPQNHRSPGPLSPTSRSGSVAVHRQGSAGNGSVASGGGGSTTPRSSSGGRRISKKDYKLAVALWDYDPTTSTQVHLAKDHKYYVIKTKDTGWSLCRPKKRLPDGRKGRKGWAPTSYMQIIKSRPKAPRMCSIGEDQVHASAEVLPADSRLHRRRGSGDSDISAISTMSSMSSMSMYSIADSRLGMPPPAPAPSGHPSYGHSLHYPDQQQQYDQPQRQHPQQQQMHGRPVYDMSQAQQFPRQQQQQHYAQPDYSRGQQDHQRSWNGQQPHHPSQGRDYYQQSSAAYGGHQQEYAPHGDNYHPQQQQQRQYPPQHYSSNHGGFSRSTPHGARDSDMYSTDSVQQNYQRKLAGGPPPPPQRGSAHQYAQQHEEEDYDYRYGAPSAGYAHSSR